METAKITRFVSRKTSVLHFLALLLIFDVLIVVFGQPTEMIRYTSNQGTLPPLVQVSIVVSIGFSITILSRFLLQTQCQRRFFSPAGAVIWLIAEFIMTVGVMTFASWEITGGGSIMLAPLAADITLCTICVQVMPYVVSYLLFLLHEEHAEVERLRALLPQEAPEDPNSAESSIRFYDKSGHLSLATLRHNVLYIEAANNYSNIHFLNEDKEETFILHNSLKELEQRFRGTRLVRCHRGFIVNVDNVKLMRKDGMGFQLELSGIQRTIPVTKTYADILTQHIRVE